MPHDGTRPIEQISHLPFVGSLQADLLRLEEATLCFAPTAALPPPTIDSCTRVPVWQKGNNAVTL